MNMAGYLVLLTMILPWSGALLVWLVKDDHPRWQHGLAVAFSALAGVAALALIPFCGSQTVFKIPLGGPFGDFTFIADGLSVFLTAVATIIGCLAVVFSVDYMRGEAQLGRYYALVLLFIGAMCGLVLTSNLLLVFVFWEISALCSYALIAFHNDDPKAVAGGIKALLITQVGGIGLLLGALLVYSQFKILDISLFLQIAPDMPKNLLTVMAFGFLAAAAAKSAQFPFQTWLPDAMEAPTPISALIHAATMVNAGVYLLARFYPAFAGVPGWRTAVMFVGMLSALLTAIMALTANDLKRALAYSTVSQLGFMVYAIGAGGIFASQFHLLSHSVFKALLFLGAGAVIHSVGTRDMRQMGDLGKQMPLVRLVFILGALALAGIPILNGFWSKELILEAGLEHSNPAWMLGVMVLTAGLTALYSIRILYLVFYGQPRSALHGHEAGLAMRIALIPLAAGTLTTWLLAGPINQMLQRSLPFHELAAQPTLEILTEILLAPITLLALGVILIALVVWWQRKSLVGIWRRLNWLRRASENSFGFEVINRGIISLTHKSADLLRVTQTGLLPWNVFAIVAGLVLLMLILAVGA